MALKDFSSMAIPGLTAGDMRLGPNDQYQAVNPATGQWENLYLYNEPGNYDPVYGGGEAPPTQFFFESNRPNDPAVRVHRQDFGSSFDQAMSGFGDAIDPIARTVGPLLPLVGAAMGGAGALGYGGTAAGGAGAGAGAGGTAAGGLAGIGPGAGTGITAGAGGVTGLTSGTAGLGLPATAAAGTALAPGFFASETLAPLAAIGASGVGGSGGSGPAAAAGAWPTLREILAGGLPALFGAYASGEQADAYRDLADQYLAFGAPSRERFEGSFGPDFSLADMPGFTESMDTTTDTLLRRLSAKDGNPFGSPGGLAEIQKYVTGNVALPALNEYRRLNAGAGGLAALTAAAPGASSSAVGAERGIFDAIGAGAADIFNPPRTLEDILRDMRRVGIGGGGSGMSLA